MSTEETSGHPEQRPTLRIVRGDPTPEEIHARTVTLAAKEIGKAHQFFAMYTPEQIHELNDPDVSRGVTELMKVIAPWWETYKATKPAGLVVHQGGKQ